MAGLLLSMSVNYFQDEKRIHIQGYDVEMAIKMPHRYNWIPCVVKERNTISPGYQQCLRRTVYLGHGILL